MRCCACGRVRARVCMLRWQQRWQGSAILTPILGSSVDAVRVATRALHGVASGGARTREQARPMCCSTPHGVAIRCALLQHDALCCSMPHGVATCCALSQHGALCCNTVRCDAARAHPLGQAEVMADIVVRVVAQVAASGRGMHPSTGATHRAPVIGRGGEVRHARGRARA